MRRAKSAVSGAGVDFAQLGVSSAVETRSHTGADADLTICLYTGDTLYTLPGFVNSQVVKPSPRAPRSGSSLVVCACPKRSVTTPSQRSDVLVFGRLGPLAHAPTRRISSVHRRITRAGAPLRGWVLADYLQNVTRDDAVPRSVVPLVNRGVVCSQTLYEQLGHVPMFT